MLTLVGFVWLSRGDELHRRDVSDTVGMSYLDCVRYDLMLHSDHLDYFGDSLLMLALEMQRNQVSPPQPCSALFSPAAMVADR